MKKKQTIFLSTILFVLLVIAGGGLYYWKKGNPISLGNNPKYVKAGSIKGMPSIEYSEPNRAISSVDYGQCNPGSHDSYRAFGSDHYVFLGIEDGKCVFYKGGETENPGWDGKLHTRCEVPTFLGKTVRGLGDISQYCLEN